MLRAAWKKTPLALKRKLNQDKGKLFGIDTDLLVIPGGQIKWEKISSAPQPVLVTRGWSCSAHCTEKRNYRTGVPSFSLMHLQENWVAHHMKSEKLGTITPILLPGPPDRYNAVLPTTVQHPMNMLGLGASKSCPAQEAVPHLQPSSSRWQHKGVCPQQLCWLQATTLAGQEATAQKKAEGKSQPRGGRVMVCWAGRKGCAWSSCPTKAASHRRSGPCSECICSASAKGRLGDLAVSPGPCWDMERMLRALLEQS